MPSPPRPLLPLPLQPPPPQKHATVKLGFYFEYHRHTTPPLKNHRFLPLYSLLPTLILVTKWKFAPAVINGDGADAQKKT
ncbi:hypothetical protein HanXRQr2_Chr02g0062791 [Helianthus annuus]|uniref:Uncharacterized protein n=1 Tax=Helianthus annuus TaxID=4232 RepID=A0A9K3JPL2_HELAN|nr:hypothetical protein HanXRQr2_Chr02g0062791 [Helianthus annuus]KAJ0951574.1 hypothetical protein HanPSC8_Chr02g0061711 [Helianthus annuus]